jgi:hypothetical protein
LSWLCGTPLPAKVGTSFDDKRQPLSRYSSLAELFFSVTTIPAVATTTTTTTTPPLYYSFNPSSLFKEVCTSIYTWQYETEKWRLPLFPRLDLNPLSQCSATMYALDHTTTAIKITFLVVHHIYLASLQTTNCLYCFMKICKLDSLKFMFVFKSEWTAIKTLSLWTERNFACHNNCMLRAVHSEFTYSC